MPRPLRVFLCHASQDKPIVRELYQRLKAEKWIDPWLDEEKLSFGQHWTTAIEDALSEADVVIIFLSKNSVQKEGFVQRELNYAWELSLEKPRNVIFLIPFRLDNCQIPRYLGSRQWGDYFGDKKESTYQILLRSLIQRHGQILRIEDAVDIGSIAHKVNYEIEVGGKIENRMTLNHSQNEKDRDVRGNNFRISSGIFIAAFLAIVIFVIDSFIRNPSNSIVNQEATATSTLAVQISSPTLTQTLLPTYTQLSSTSTPIITNTPTHSIGSTMVSEIDGMVMVFVPAGEFTMGEDGDEHRVYLDSFWLDQTEVTNAMYVKCVTDGDCESPISPRLYSRENYYGNPEFANYPVLYVDWNRANAYCSWAGRKLPTEAEWEKAARGTDGRTYPWGEDVSCEKANYSYCVGNTTKVGSYPDGASIYGVLDMAGNVWEWVSSLYKNYPYNENDGREDQTASGSRVLRGGSWFVNGSGVRSAYRYAYYDDISSWIVGTTGFRCALSQP